MRARHWGEIHGRFLFLILGAFITWGASAVMAQSPGIPVVTVLATQPDGTAGNPGVFTVFRAGDTNVTLEVWYDLGGSASNGGDYAPIPPHLITLPAGVISNSIIIKSQLEYFGTNTVILTLTNSPLASPVNYEIGSPSEATVYVERPLENPPIAIYEPTNGAVFVAPTNIVLGAFLDGYVFPYPANIEFFAGTNDLGAAQDGLGHGVYLTVWLTWTNPAPGSYAITAVTTTGTGSSATSAPVNIVVLGPATNPPSVTIILPQNNAMFYAPTNIGVIATAGAESGVLTNVEFFAGAADLGAGVPVVIDPPGVDGVTGPAYFFNWQNPLPGAYSLTAIATVYGGVSATSAPVNISVRPVDGRPPVVRWVSPANGTVYRAPVDIPLYAYANDPAGVVAVEFFADTNDLGPGAPLSAAPQTNLASAIVAPTNLFSRIWSNAPAGAWSLTARAIDCFGLITTSAPVQIAVFPSPPPPPNRPGIVFIVATDPIAVAGTNCWVWSGDTNAPPSWTHWPPSAISLHTNCAPKAATFTVWRIGDTNADLAVNYAIGGTASNGVDYVALPGFITIPAGQVRAFISVVPLEEVPLAVAKTVVLTLGASTNRPPSYLVGVPARAAAIILNSEGVRPVAAMLPDGMFHLASPGPDAAWFAIEYSIDLRNWIPVCTNQVVNGSIDFVDPDASADCARYYRAVPVLAPPEE